MIENIKMLIDYACENYKTAAAFKYKNKKDVITKTYVDIKNDSEAFSNVVESLDLKGKHVAVIGPTTYEYVIAYFGVVNTNSVIVPLDAQLPATDICELLNRADIECLVFDEMRADVMEMAKEKCSGIKSYICMQQEASNENALSFWESIDKNRKPYAIELDADKVCSILFTSGTTGKSKGVMLSHRNLVDNVTSFEIDDIKHGDVLLSVLPIHHAYCFTMDILRAIYSGLTNCINDSIMHFQKNVKFFKPSIILMVPLIVESLYNKLSDKAGIMPKKMVAGIAFGGNLRTIVSGGAYLSQKYIDGMKDYGITVLQGYGMTECSPLISASTSENIKENAVGKLVSNCEAKIVEDEIWVRGSSVMKGYYKMPDETSETLVDGWLRTGDLGYVDEEGFVFITGRKKNLIILANGENISPEEIENEISIDRLIKEVLVYGEDNKIIAEIFPDEEYVAKKKIKDINESLGKIIDKYNQDLPLYKQITKIIVREVEFEKTPSKKIKRQYTKI